MATLLRLALLAAGAALVVLFIYSPGRWRQFGRRVKVVAYAYVAAILIGTVLRLLGFYGV